MLQRRLSLLPSGTTSNEGLHAELNKAFAQVQRMHQATLKLKLVVLTMAKQIAHDCAMTAPTTRQLMHGMVLARACTTDWWTDQSWRAWCGELTVIVPGRVAKSTLPLSAERAEQKLAVKAHLDKKPACSPMHTRMKRTPFTRKRSGVMVTAGVRRDILKGTTKKPACSFIMKRPSAKGT